MAASFSASASHFVALIAKDGGSASYDKWAKSYEDDVNSMNYGGYKSVVSKWLSYHTQLAKGETLKHKIFDAGCGTGLVGENLVSLVPRDLIDVYGGDVSSNMLEIARTKNVYTDLQIVNLNEELPYAADSFDSVLCAGVFGVGHCGHACLPNLIRVLKRGCHLFATVNGEVYDVQRLEWAKQIKDCNCELIEDNEMPYREAAKAVVVVIHKL
jgi:ubiquinone/menaquinone biosynthesis C-methylase UbiE